jgi:hypothetical protein
MNLFSYSQVIDHRWTHPINFNAVTEEARVESNPPDSVLTLMDLRVTNFQRALVSSGVSSVFQVLNVIIPSMPPVAKTPVCEYSRSWKAKDVIVGGRFGEDDIRSNVVIGRALIVCKQSFLLEHVAI